MRWSVKLGRYAGIDVYLHVTFLAFLALIGYDQLASGGSAALAADAVLFFCAVFGCVLLHEFGHALTARRFGIRTRDITLLPIGGVARLERMPDRPMQELCVALAGPAVNVVIALLLALWLVATGGLASNLGGIDLAHGSLAVRLLLVNAALVIFNMIPAFPMDGGRVLRALLATQMEHVRATRIAATLGRTIAVLFAIWALAGMASGHGNPILLLIAVFVWFGAGQEARAAQFRSSLFGTTVRDAMSTRYVTLSPMEPLARAMNLMVAGTQQDFPVLEGRRMVGLLTRQRLLAGLAEQGRGAAVAMSMEREFPTVAPHQSLAAVLSSHRRRTCSFLPVLERGELVGLLAWDQLSECVFRASSLTPLREPPVLVPPVLRG